MPTRRPFKKLDHKKAGPFQIIKVVGKQAYRLQLLEGSRAHCGGANDGRTPILGCTQELWRKAAYCIDVVVCVQEKRKEKREKVE